MGGGVRVPVPVRVNANGGRGGQRDAALLCDTPTVRCGVGLHALAKAGDSQRGCTVC